MRLSGTVTEVVDTMRHGRHDVVDLTIVFTDIVASTQRWESDPDTMRELLTHHDAVTEQSVAASGGTVHKHTGDGVIAVFSDPVAALDACVAIQRGLAAGPAELGTPEVEPLAVRIGAHRGVVERRAGDLFGPPMNRCARIAAAGHGGQVLVSGVLADGVSDHPAVRLRDVGVHRLRGLHQPERLLQLVVEGLPSEFPELRTENVDLGWLPAVSEGIIGREGELHDVAGLVERRPLVTLVGPGGVGKTRLSLHVAQHLRSSFPDGVWFVDLAAVSEPDRVVTAIVAGVGLTVEGGAALVDEIRAALSTRRMLVLLDNCEHVLEATSDALGAVVDSDIRSAILCTSQRHLGLEVEDVVYLAPLDSGRPSTGPSGSTFPMPEPDVESSAPAVRLFVERAREADPGFLLTAANHATVTAICRRLDGLPLAIELAAARIRTLSPDDVLDNLDGALALLRSRDGVGRHRTLRHAIGWSIDLLDAGDADVMDSLSVFQGPFTWRSAAAVCGLDGFDAIDVLDELCSRSLVMRDEDEFRLLAPVREFCSERLGERSDAVRERLARWILHELPSPVDDPDPATARANIDRAVRWSDDTRTAFVWLLEHHPDEAAELALRLTDVWTTRSMGQEAREWLGRCDVSDVSPALRTRILGWLASADWLVGRNEESEAAARKAIRIAEEHGLPYPAYAGARLALRLSFSGNAEEADEHLHKTVHALDADPSEASRLYGILGIVHAIADDEPAAVAIGDRGVALAREVGAVHTITALVNRMIATPGAPETFDMAREVADLAVAIRRPSAAGYALLGIAHLHEAARDDAAQLRSLADGCDIMLSAGMRTATVNFLEFAHRPMGRTYPREAASMLAALRALSGELEQGGFERVLSMRDATDKRVRAVLTEEELGYAVGEGAGLSLEQAVDLLRWAADAHAESVTVLVSEPASESGSESGSERELEPG